LSAARGNGRGVAATRLLVKYLFTTTDVHRIEASTDVENVAAQRVLSRAGFGREGVLRGAQLRGGEHRDMVVYSVLRPAEPSTDALIQRDNVMLSELTAADRNTIAAGGDGLFDVDPDPRIPRYLGRGGALAVRAVDTGELLGDVSYAILTHGPTAASDTWNVGIELLPQARGR